MIARRPRFVVLAVAGSLAWMGCQPAVRPPAGNQQGRPLVQEKAGPKVVRFQKADEDLIRVRLLMVETVQKDLGLTADQVREFSDLVKTSEQEYREFFAKTREILPPSRAFSPEEFEPREREFRALSEDFNRRGKELRTKALGVLTPGQSERLKQIQLQVQVPAALARPEIIKALGISEEQSGKIRAVCDHVDEKQLAKWPDLRGLSPKECRQKWIEFKKESDQANAGATKLVLDVLTPEQRTKLEKLQGKKIEVTWPYDAMIPEDADLWSDFR